MAEEGKKLEGTRCRMGRETVNVAWSTYQGKDGKAKPELEAMIVEYRADENGLPTDIAPKFQGGKPVKLSGTKHEWDRLIEVVLKAIGERTVPLPEPTDANQKVLT